MKFLYSIFIELLIFGMKIYSIFNEKTKKGIDGRKLSVQIVEKTFQKTDEIIWMHAASLGEYEQGLPVLSKLKEKLPQYKILITFFSPSGYENVVHKNHIADAIVYLPFDNKWRIKEFTSKFTTKIFITVKYDFWYNLLEDLKLQGAKTYVISALFYEKQVFFKFFGGFFRKELKKNIDWFFHQTENSFNWANSIGLEQSSVSGDTRFDRVKEFQTRDNFVEKLADFKQEMPLFVFGSSWEAEEKVAEMLIKNNQSIKIIIAPHDISRSEKIKNKFSESILYSQFLNTQTLKNLKTQILIIDNIGLLSKLYSYADIAFVGGGFHSSGLHNILEAAIFGVPVFFGNHYKKNPEADGLIAANAAKSFENEIDAVAFLIKIIEGNNADTIYTMGKNAEKFIHSQPNSTEIIVGKILENLS